MVQGSPWVYGNNKHIQKIDLRTGKEVWMSDKIVGMSTEFVDLILATENTVVTKIKSSGLGNNYTISWLDTKTGKVRHQSDKQKTKTSQPLSILNSDEEQLIDYNKDGLVYYDLKNGTEIKRSQEEALVHNIIKLDQKTLVFNNKSVRIFNKEDIKPIAVTIDGPKAAYIVNNQLIIEGVNELVIIDSDSMQEKLRKQFGSSSYQLLSDLSTVLLHDEQSISFIDL